MAGKKKCKCPPPGAPDWMLTYGDMMTLLLCFFVLIVSFSEIKKDGMFEAVVEEIREAFGMKGGGGKLPTEEDPQMSWIQRLVAVQLFQKKTPTRSDTTDPGVEGRERLVTRIREGQMQSVGGAIFFEPGSATLTAEAARKLRDVAEQMRGKTNLIEVRGHASKMELHKSDTKFQSLWALSYARAEAVMRLLTSDRVGLPAERFRLIANADREPLVQRAYTSVDQQPNRRVEIFESETVTRQLQKPEF